MNCLLVIQNKLYKTALKTLCRKKNCEVIILENNLSKSLKSSKNRPDKFILITEKILARTSYSYKCIKNYISTKKIFFVEIGYEKSNIPTTKTISNAIINGAGTQTDSILAKIIHFKYD